MEKMKPDTHHKNNLKILIIFALFLSLLVDAAAAGHSHKHHSRGEHAPASAAVRSSCAATRSPDLCLSTSAVAVQASALNLKKLWPKLEKAFDVPISKIKKNFIPKLEGLLGKRRNSLKRREVSALHDCIVMSMDTANQINASKGIVKEYIKSNDISVLAAHKVELYNLLSAAQTNVLTCLDGFSHGRADKLLQATRLKANLEEMYSDASKLMSAVDGEFNKFKAQPLKSGMGEVWPKWLTDDDKKLLEDPAGKVVPDLTVAKKGGTYQTVSEAVKAMEDVMKAMEDAPKKKSSKTFVISIKEGEYMENVVIPKVLTNFMFVGDGYDKTFIIATKNVVDGDTSFSSATVGVAGDGFIARGITFENRAGPSKLHAVALRVNADRTVFYNCSMIGYQNTLYVHSLRQFYKNCTITGTVNFIFGNAAAFFLDCDIQARPPNPGQKNTITAQGRTLPSQNTGIIFQKCRITATPGAKEKFTTYLGRPWKEYSTTVVMQTEISNVIDLVGWSEWEGKFALDTLYYAEYMNHGAGAGTGSRVNWKGFQVLTKEKDVEPFTIGNFLGGKSY